MNEESYTPDSWDDMEGVNPPSQTLDLVGHDQALKALVKNYHDNRLHHAWLLSGLKGIGKATLAYRFAEFLLRYPLAENAPSDFVSIDDPVHSQVSKGAQPNLLVLRKPWDQKSKKFKTQITVDEIRRVSAFLQSSSGANAWRIVIVDSADEMNNSASNALLKVLEEPPARTIFFILAHSPRGLLPTIRSRCQVMALKELGDSDLKTVLKRQALTTDLDDDEISKLLLRSKGSVRRALMLVNSGALKLFDDFLEIVSHKQGDIGRLHLLAGKLAPAAKSREFSLFMDLVYDHLADMARDMASNDQIALNKIAGLANIWDQTREANMRAETWNMDKKQVILDLYREMRAA